MMKHDGITPRECDGAKEFAKKRLMESNEPLSPRELAEQYDCSGSHMRSKLSELKQSGEIENASYGYYDIAEDNTENQESNNSAIPDTTDSVTDYQAIEPDDITDPIVEDSMTQHTSNAPDNEPVTPALPAEPKQLLVIFSVLIGLYLLYQTLGSEDETPTSSESENTADNQGGLIQ